MKPATRRKCSAKKNPCQQAKRTSSGRGRSDQIVSSTGTDKAKKPAAPRSTKGKKRPATIEATTNSEATHHNEEDHAPVAKRTRKILNKKERESLLRHLNSVDDVTLADAVNVRLSEVQLLSTKLKNFADTLCKNEQLLQDIATHHHCRFSELYVECKKESDPFVQLQFQWHRYCSAFLLPRMYTLDCINFDETSESSLVSLRNKWLSFCEVNDVPVESNPVMISMSSAIYAVLLEQAREYQTSLISEPGSSKTVVRIEGDDVYFRFGGAALCDMLHLHYKQIKGCSDAQRDKLSQEITILQSINTKDKSKIPEYLKYRDRGYMYFPDISFIPFIRQVDEVVKGVVSEEKMEGDGGQIIKAAHEKIKSCSSLEGCFLSTLSKRLPNMDTFSTEALDNVFTVFTRKLCNTRIQEFISSTKQQMASKKGLASTVDTNLRPMLLAQHTKLESKFVNNKGK
ncbi:uncharacterized protein [Dysidea avara]|uniref:uncharacterized protein n=1 Tax=Dysidea avara TaxID=196820 RepID=UPI00331DDC72